MAEVMTGLKRTHYCGEPRLSDVGKEVVVCGWAQRQRDLGQLIFIDLRDRTGIIQLAFDDHTDKEIFGKAFGVRAEFVLAAKGVVRERSSKNKEIPTGEVEIEVTDLRVLSKSETPPFEITEDSKVKEETPVSTPIQALGVVSGTDVRVRSGAGTGYDILKTLDKGTLVELTVQEGDWYRISYDGARGYIASQYVTRYDSATGLSGAGKVTADVLNIRSAPKSGSTSLGTASHGAVLTVTGIEGSWFAVSYNGVSGYVASQYVLICSPSTADTSAPETPEETPAETPDETPADNPAATVSGSEIVSLAQQYLGVPYVYGGSSPSGFDCSGFTMYIFAQVGVKLPHGATSQLSYGASVSRSELQPGDLVFFQDYGAVASHVGIYIGGDQFIHASSSSGNSRCVTVSSLAESYYANHYYTARRH